MVIEMVRRRVQARLERKRTGPEEWLIITRRLLTDARTWEAKASPDATDQDVRYRYHSYLSPTCVSDGELEKPSLSELARVIANLWRDVAFLAPWRIARPLFGQSQAKVEQGMILVTDIAHEDADLAVVHLAPVAAPGPFSFRIQCR